MIRVMLTLLHNTNPGNLSNKILTCKKKASFETVAKCECILSKRSSKLIIDCFCSGNNLEIFGSNASGWCAVWFSVVNLGSKFDYYSTKSNNIEINK